MPNNNDACVSYDPLHFQLRNGAISMVYKLQCNSARSLRGCFTNISWALQNILAKINNIRYHIYGENFKLKLRTCAQSLIALGTRTKFKLKILIKSTIPAIHKFRENMLESSRNFSETTLSRLHDWNSKCRVHFEWRRLVQTVNQNQRLLNKL